MERRFVSLDFKKGRISAYVAIGKNRPLRVMALDCGSEEIMRNTKFLKTQLEQFRCNPTNFGRPASGDEAA